MLRITIHEDGRLYRLELAGRLAGPWVAETENVWNSAHCLGKEIEVDLREVTGIDGAGRTLLVAMNRTGARLVAQGVEMTALVQEITGLQPFNGTKRQPRRGKSGRRATFPNQERQ